MTWLMWSPFVANVILAAAGPRLARTLPPRAAVRLVPLAMLAVALGVGFVLAVLGVFVVAQFPPIAVLAHWSPAALRADQPVPALAGVAGTVILLVLLGAALLRAARGGSDLVRAAVACRRLGPDADGLVVIDDDEPEAYAVPGLAGRIVVSTGMLNALGTDERHVLLAHEAAHLAGHHHVYIQLADLGAAANPLLRGTARSVRLAVERAADEAAAAEVGDRRLVARALARAGLAKAVARRRRQPQTRVVLAGADTSIMQRTTALLAPAPRPRRGLVAGLLLLTLVSVVGTGVTAHQTDDRLDRAATGATVAAGH
ncbi:MAG TPA: M48 family metalloprotease [Kineosporiaceae bacterium]|nr:M48 family metalloprotease [Kineosporiaceae bacterium]